MMTPCDAATGQSRHDDDDDDADIEDAVIHGDAPSQLAGKKNHWRRRSPHVEVVRVARPRDSAGDRWSPGTRRRSIEEV